jgi:hypothetical protein
MSALFLSKLVDLCKEPGFVSFLRTLGSYKILPSLDFVDLELLASDILISIKIIDIQLTLLYVLIRIS